MMKRVIGRQKLGNSLQADHNRPGVEKTSGLLSLEGISEFTGP